MNDAALSNSTPGPDIAVAASAIVLDMAPVKDVTGGRDLDLVTDLGFDSLSLLEVIVAVEDELGLTVVGGRPPAAPIATLGDVEDYVRTLLSASAPR
jgi:acyl carrier protein